MKRLTLLLTALLLVAAADSSALQGACPVLVAPSNGPLVARAPSGQITRDGERFTLTLTGLPGRLASAERRRQHATHLTTPGPSSLSYTRAGQNRTVALLVETVALEEDGAVTLTGSLPNPGSQAEIETFTHPILKR